MIGIYAKELDGTWFGVACDDKLVYGTTFASNEKTAIANLKGAIPRGLEFEKKKEVSEFAAHIIETTKHVYDGKAIDEKVAFHMKYLPAFTRRVLEATYKVPIGYVASYGGIAKAVGGGARAVGNVMAMNPFCPLVPCHRVVRSDLGLGGYGGGYGSGLKVKLSFLKREKRGYGSKKEIQVEGGKLEVFPVEEVLKKAVRHK
jgi:methylated-DNA-[protein]-cysteine S-methyltransferase